MLRVLTDGPRCLVHRDFFAGNLIWLPDRTGVRRVGILDFQGAARGHPAYDLVSLLQDARRDIPRPVADGAIARYLAARPELDPDAFGTAYAICAAQRHLRVACQWVRLPCAITGRTTSRTDPAPGICSGPRCAIPPRRRSPLPWIARIPPDKRANPQGLAP